MMDWVDAKILAHGKWDAACNPAQVTLPANVALVFYCRHGDTVLGDQVRPVETKDLTTLLRAELTRRGRGVPPFTHLSAAIEALVFRYTPRTYVVSPLATCHNYRLTHLGTALPVPDPNNAGALLAALAPAAGSSTPMDVVGPYFMPAPTQRVPLEFVIHHFLAPLAPANGFAVGHCLFCREI